MADLPDRGTLEHRLRAATTARVGLGRIGSALPTAEVLDFQLSHARARDAVHAGIAPGELGERIGGLPVLEVCSRAGDRQTYLMRPDLGRQLVDADASRLAEHPCELAIVIADGLSAAAVRAHALALTQEILNRSSQWGTGSIVVAHQARVALGDEIGEAMTAKLVIVLIGERPGLSAADSLSAYITWDPKCGRLDSERNCISNIRPPHGLELAAAADLIMAVANAARQSGRSGTALKIASRPASPALPDPYHR